MISDAEHREIAARLRNLADSPEEIGIPEHAVISALGISGGFYDDCCKNEDVLALANLIDHPTGKVVSKHERDTRVPYRLGTDHYCEFEFYDEYVYFGDMVEVFWDAYDGERSCVGRLCSVDYGEDGFICGAFLRDEDDDALFVPCDGVFYKPEKGAER